MSNSGSVGCMKDMHKVRARHRILQSVLRKSRIPVLFNPVMHDCNIRR